MRLSISKSKNSTLLDIIESTYININKKHSTRIIEKLGTLEEVKLKAGTQDPIVWSKNYALELTKQDKENKRKIIKSFSQSKLIDKNIKISFNGGYLFLQKIYYDLKLNNICEDITNKYQYKFDLNNILSNLIYSRIIYPSSKLKSLELSKNFIEQPKFEYHHILRVLEVISKENDFIQSSLYKNSLNYSERNDKISFYDCTNYYFEIENDDDFRKYGKSK